VQISGTSRRKPEIITTISLAVPQDSLARFSLKFVIGVQTLEGWRKWFDTRGTLMSWVMENGITWKCHNLSDCNKTVIFLLSCLLPAEDHSGNISRSSAIHSALCPDYGFPYFVFIWGSYSRTLLQSAWLAFPHDEGLQLIWSQSFRFHFPDIYPAKLCLSNGQIYTHFPPLAIVRSTNTLRPDLVSVSSLLLCFRPVWPFLLWFDHSCCG
jgi:hypothetical protein